MGQQINFYMHGDDEGEFLAAARRKGELKILPHTSLTAPFEPLEDLPGPDVAGWFQVWLWNEAVCKAPVVYPVDKQDCFAIHSPSSEVVELARSFELDGALIRGRLWVEMSGWKLGATDQIIKKSDGFRKWSNSLTGWIKRRYTRLPTGDYLGPGAAEFQSRGGPLRQAGFARTVKVVRH